jgi:hypothetical protein
MALVFMIGQCKASQKARVFSRTYSRKSSRSLIWADVKSARRWKYKTLTRLCHMVFQGFYATSTLYSATSQCSARIQVLDFCGA